VERILALAHACEQSGDIVDIDAELVFASSLPIALKIYSAT
jgi:hypothetical protein